MREQGEDDTWVVIGTFAASVMRKQGWGGTWQKSPMPNVASNSSHTPYPMHLHVYLHKRWSSSCMARRVVGVRRAPQRLHPEYGVQATNLELQDL